MSEDEKKDDLKKLVIRIAAGALGGAIGGAIAGFGVSIGLQGISKGFENINWQQVGADTLSGAGSGAIAGGIFGGIKYVAGASKVASSLSGIVQAQNKYNKALFVLQNTPLNIAGGVISTERVVAQLSFNVASANLGFAKSVYKVIDFTVTQLYRLAQLGLKQLTDNILG